MITFVHLFKLIFILQFFKYTWLFLCKKSTDAGNNNIHCSWRLTFGGRFRYHLNNLESQWFKNTIKDVSSDRTNWKSLSLNKPLTSTLGTLINICFGHCLNIPRAHLFLLQVHFPRTWPLHRLILLAQNAVKQFQKRVKNSNLNLDFTITHSIVLTLVTPFLKRQITITIQFFVTRSLPTSSYEKFVKISIFFYSWGANEKLFQKLVHLVSSRLPNTRKQ